MTTDEFRNAVLQAIHAQLGKDGARKIDEQSVADMLDMLSDDELAEGMPFNTPDDVAETLIESA